MCKNCFTFVSDKGLQKSPCLREVVAVAGKMSVAERLLRLSMEESSTEKLVNIKPEMKLDPVMVEDSIPGNDFECLGEGCSVKDVVGVLRSVVRLLSDQMAHMGRVSDEYSQYWPVSLRLTQLILVLLLGSILVSLWSCQFCRLGDLVSRLCRGALCWVGSFRCIRLGSESDSSETELRNRGNASVLRGEGDHVHEPAMELLDRLSRGELQSAVLASLSGASSRVLSDSSEVSFLHSFFFSLSEF